MDGVFLFEGMDGSGKTTLVKSVFDALEARGDEVGDLRYPSNAPIGRFICDNLFTGKEEVDPRAMLPLMVADGMDMDRTLEAYRQTYKYVLLDRHPMVSTWIYQLDDHPLAVISGMASAGVFKVLPKIVFILDVPAEVAMERRGKRQEEANPLFEKDLEHTSEIRGRYTAYYALNRGNGPFVLLDGTLSTEELTGLVLRILDEST